MSAFSLFLFDPFDLSLKDFQIKSQIYHTVNFVCDCRQLQLVDKCLPADLEQRAFLKTLGHAKILCTGSESKKDP